MGSKTPSLPSSPNDSQVRTPHGRTEPPTCVTQPCALLAYLPNPRDLGGSSRHPSRSSSSEAAQDARLSDARSYPRSGSKASLRRASGSSRPHRPPNHPKSGRTSESASQTHSRPSGGTTQPNHPRARSTSSPRASETRPRSRSTRPASPSLLRSSPRTLSAAASLAPPSSSALPPSSTSSPEARSFSALRAATRSPSSRFLSAAARSPSPTLPPSP